MMDLATVDKLLTTTRSVRKRLDFSRPVPPEVIEECIDIALQAPSASNSQGWHFLVVTDAEKRRAIGEIYRTLFTAYRARPVQAEYPEGDPRAASRPRVRESSDYLADHMHEAPVLIIPCVLNRVENAGVAAQASLYGSILPAAWSLMLALRARGLGSAWTTIHLAKEAEVGALLGIPPTVTQTALLPVAYYTGDDFKPAKRLPGREVTSWDSWGTRRD